MTLHLKSRGYPFRPRLLFSSFIVVGVGFPTVYYFRRGHCDCFTASIARQTAPFVAIALWGIVVFQWAIGEYPREDQSSRWRR